VFGRRHRDESDDLRTFIREIMARYDRGMALVEARLDRQAEDNRRYFEKLDAKTDEILAEGRAGREALFRILDRMDGNGGTAPAG
jgi:hypothetical protein